MDVELYRTAAGREVVEEFLDSLPNKDLAKVLRDIDVLAQYAPDLHEPYAKHIDGPIWELRSKFSSNIHRIFYFIWHGNRLILLHGFTKKTPKTPPSEIKIAKERLADYQNRYP
jgi:phage-related protein